MWVDVPQISLLSFFFSVGSVAPVQKKTLPGTEPSGQVFEWVHPRRNPLHAAVEILRAEVPVRSRAEGASLGAGGWVLGGTLVVKGPGREVDDRKWTEWAGKLVVDDRGARAGVVVGVPGYRVRRALPDCVVELARGASGGVWRRPPDGLEFLERRQYQKCCAPPRAAMSCAVMEQREVSFPQPVRSSHSRDASQGVGLRKLAGTACTCFCRLFRNDEVARAHARWHAGMLARWHDGTMPSQPLWAVRWTTRPLPGMQAAGSSCRWRGGWTIAYLGVRTEERATLRSETGAGGYEPSGWMGGRLRKGFKGVAIHYGREGGGMRKKTSILEFGVDSADC